MCYELVYMVFDFLDESSLKNNAHLAHFLTALANAGDFNIAEPETAWERAVKNGQRSVWMTAEGANRLSLTFSLITNNWRRFYISLNRQQASQPGHLRSLVRAGNILYQTLQPDYGFGLVSLDVQPPPLPGEGDYGLNVLYDYNYLSPRLVDKLERGRVLATPSWRTTSFTDGGLLLELTPNPFTERKAYAEKYQQAANALGVSKYQQVS